MFPQWKRNQQRWRKRQKRKERGVRAGRRKKAKKGGDLVHQGGGGGLGAGQDQEKDRENAGIGQEAVEGLEIVDLEIGQEIEDHVRGQEIEDHVKGREIAVPERDQEIIGRETGRGSDPEKWEREGGVLTDLFCPLFNQSIISDIQNLNFKSIIHSAVARNQIRPCLKLVPVILCKWNWTISVGAKFWPV